MRRSTSLTTRAFVLSFVPLCLVLMASFLGFNAAVRHQVRISLRETLERSEELVLRSHLESEQRIGQFVAVAAENAGLKAAVGLAHEGARSAEAAAEVRQTIEAQLGELHMMIGYDVMAVTDWKGRTIATMDFRPDAQADGKLPAFPAGHGLVQFGDAQVGGAYFDFASFPIVASGEEIAMLRLGSRFDLRRYRLDGEIALLRDGRVVLSTLSPAASAVLETRLKGTCGSGGSGCEVGVGGEKMLVLPIREPSLGPGYTLVEVRSLDAAVRDFTSGWPDILAAIAGAGVLVAVGFTFATSRSVSKPLRDLVRQLNESEPAGRFPEKLTADGGVGELQRLAEGFNAVAASERLSRQELELAKDLAEAADRAKTEFLGKVSHELRTPMNGVLGMTDLLMLTGLDEDQRDYAATIRESADGLMRLIEDLLDFSKLEAGRMTIDHEPLDLRECVAGVVRAIEPQARGKGLALSVTYAGDAPSRFLGDSPRIARIVANLAGNAVKFTERGTVRIAVSCEDRGPVSAAMRIAVEDTGAGVPADKVDVIFERFTQVDGSITRRYGGTGIGLALVKQLVIRMHGSVGARSKPGEGSAFWCTLPLDLDPAAVRKEVVRC